MRTLLTGGNGFIGAALADHLVRAGHDVDLLDSITYAADPDRLLERSRTFVCDITSALPARALRDDYEWVIHLAAETHVDASIVDPLRFVHTNVVGTAHVLEFARTLSQLERLLYFSTDEVFGPAPASRRYLEWDRYNSGNPYAATKAGAEELVLAYGNTYGLPVQITHTMNAFGPTQHREKFIPSTVEKVLAGETVIVHADSTRTRAGSRFYIHVDDIARAVELVLEQGATQDKFNIVGEQEVDNLELAELIADELSLELHAELVDYHSARPGHDLRYALDGTKLAMMGWAVETSFEHKLRSTVREIAKRLELG